MGQSVPGWILVFAGRPLGARVFNFLSNLTADTPRKQSANSFPEK